MRHLVKLLDVVYSLVDRIDACIPNSKHYVGKLPEGFSAPCFVYTIVFNKNERASKHTKDAILDFQIVYLHTTNAYNECDYEDKLRIADQLKSFLDIYVLPVRARRLLFDYALTEVDAELAIDITFRFKDHGVVDETCYDMMGHLYINREEV